jgi:alpha-tubulin suppressor-like RCC1 family protein
LRSIGEVDGARKVALPETGGHVLVLTTQGRVQGWGLNAQGQLGPGRASGAGGWSEVDGLSGVTAIAAGAQHSLALKSDGTVWAWGANSEGQLGDGTLVQRSRPAAVTGLSGVSMIAAGPLFSVALKSDGSVWVFGSNWSGLASHDARKMLTEPVRVEGLQQIQAVDVRQARVYALDGQGRAWALGRSGEGTEPGPVMLSGPEAGQVAARLMAARAGAVRTSMDWPAAAAAGRVVDVQGGLLSLTEGGARQQYALAGPVVDAAAGWAVAVITGTPAAPAGDGLVSVGGGGPATGAATSQAARQAAALQDPGRTAISGVVQVVASGNSSLVVRADGTVRAWGGNGGAVLGDGTGVEQPLPVCSLLSGVKSLSNAGSHGLALMQDTSVWSWGVGSFGLLGDGVVTSHVVASPKKIQGFTGVVAVASGYLHSVALRSDGTVWAWGSNTSGQLGNGTTNDSGVPMQVAGLTGITSIAAGKNHSLARRNDGAVFAWGDNTFGQLGDGTQTDRWSPVRLTGFTASSVSANDNHSLAIRADGTLWGWGDGTSLGLVSPGIIQYVTAPAKLVSFTNVVQVSNQYGLNGILRADGTVWYLGSGLAGRYGGNLISDVETQFVLPKPAIGVAVGQDHVMVLLNDGTVQVMGGNSNSELGRPDLTSSDPFVAPDAGPGCTFATQKLLTTGQRIANGRTLTMIVRGDGTVWGAGSNDLGQMGIGLISNPVRTARQVPGLSGMAGVSTRNKHVLAVGADGRVWSWGSNSLGQIGDGTFTNRLSPVLVPGLTGVKRVAAGGNHSLALKQDGTVWGWGSNGVGELGTGVPIPTLVPTQTIGLTNVVEIAAGDQFSLALRSDGTVWTWGLGIGQVGPPQYLTPVQVSGLANIVAIAAGAEYALALRQDGTVWAWGAGGLRRLGSGPGTDPVIGLARVGYLTEVVSIGVGVTHGMAIKADGTLWTWGTNSKGELGMGVASAAESPVAGQVPQVFGTAEVSGGDGYTMAWERDGQYKGWGSNLSGVFGIATPTSSLVPILSGFQPGLPFAASPLSFTPQGGSTSTQKFQADFGAAAGSGALLWVQALFATQPDGGGQPFCYLHYDVVGDGLWMYGDGGFFVGPIKPGVASSLLQNSLCAINTANTTTTGGASGVSVKFEVVFKQAGSRQLYLRQWSLPEGDSGWIQGGTWNYTPAPPPTFSVLPNAGSGSSTTFVATYTDQSGLPATIGGWVQFLVAAAADGGGLPFCYLHYDRAGNGLWMYSGDVGFFLGPVAPGVSSTALQSTACSINTAGTTVQTPTGQLIISAPVTLKAPMSGSKLLFQRSMDALQRDSGWVETGSWVVP